MESENPHYDGGKPLIIGKLSTKRTTPAVARFFGGGEVFQGGFCAGRSAQGRHIAARLGRGKPLAPGIRRKSRVQRFDIEPFGHDSDQAAVGGGRGPGVVRRSIRQAGPDGVEIDVGEGGEKVVRVENAGIEPALPETSAAVEPAVEVLGVLRGDVLEQTADAAFHLAGEHEMKVVGHEDVAIDAAGDENAALVGVMVEQGREIGCGPRR